MNSHKIESTEFSYETTGDKIDKPKNNLFDNSESPWVSLNPNTDSFKNTIFINFTNSTLLESIIYSSFYSMINSKITFCGIPTVLIIYASSGEKPFLLQAVFTGKNFWKKTEFIFESPIKCDKIQIEFYKLKPDTCFSNGKECAVAKEIFLIKHIPNENLPILAANFQLNILHMLQMETVHTFPFQMHSIIII